MVHFRRHMLLGDGDDLTVALSLAYRAAETSIRVEDPMRTAKSLLLLAEMEAFSRAHGGDQIRMQGLLSSLGLEDLGEVPEYCFDLIERSEMWRLPVRIFRTLYRAAPSLPNVRGQRARLLLLSLIETS